MPMKMARLQAVVMRENVYVGGGCPKRSSSMILSLPTKWFSLPWLSSWDTSSQWGVRYHKVAVMKPLSGTLLTPLPVPCFLATSVTIADTWYQLGGVGTDNALPTVLYAPLTSLIQKATSSTHQSASPMSVWKTLPDDTLLTTSGAASLSGNLLAVGVGKKGSPFSPAVYVFLPLTNSWVRATGNLPEAHRFCTAVQLSSNRVLVGRITRTSMPTQSSWDLSPSRAGAIFQFSLCTTNYYFCFCTDYDFVTITHSNFQRVGRNVCM